MVSPLAFVPLLLAVVFGLVLLVVPYSRPLNRRFMLVARVAFERFIDEEAEKHIERNRLLQSAYVSQPYSAYAVRTYLYAVCVGLVGGVFGAYLVWGLIAAVPIIGDSITSPPAPLVSALGPPSEWSVELSLGVWIGVVSASTLVAGVASGLLTYVLRWQQLSGKATVRRRKINESLPRTVAFLYAQSRGGMPFATIMDTLSANQEVYGETAAEIAVAAREMELFGTDMITAIEKMADRTPSEEFKTFGDNLASVLQSGQDLPGFLHDQYERYREQAEERQAELLEQLATIAEGYVTVLVAGSLFFLTILMVFGLTMSDTLGILQILGYAIIPLVNIGFMVYLDSRLAVLGIGDESGSDALDDMTLLVDEEDPAADARADDASINAATDGGQLAGVAENFERLKAHDRSQRVRNLVSTPLQTVLKQPYTLLYVTIPLALLVTALRMPAALTGVGVNIRVVDDLVIQAALFVMGSYAVFRYLYKRRIRSIEAANPELLERLASLNEAGMSVIESFDRAREGELGGLSEEVDRIWTDIEMGANVEDALVRFGRRVRTTPVTRSVTLLSKAMRASGNLGAVLRIAATQARADLRMKRQRRREMLTYLVVIYISFAVFLVIIVAMESVLVPSLPDNVPMPEGGAGVGGMAGQFSRLGNVDKAAYTLAFFHTALVQGVMSGLIGGQLGEGTVRDGAKHAFVMLGIAYVAFLVLSAPVATLEFSDQYGGGDSLTVQSASLSSGGYVVLHQDSPNGTVIGKSEYLAAGTHKDVQIDISENFTEETTVVAVPHLDANGNREFDGNSTDRIYPPRLSAIKAEATLN